MSLWKKKKKMHMFLLKSHVVKALQVKSLSLDRKVSCSFELPLLVAMLFALKLSGMVKGILFTQNLGLMVSPSVGQVLQ